MSGKDGDVYQEQLDEAEEDLTEKHTGKKIFYFLLIMTLIFVVFMYYKGYITKTDLIEIQDKLPDQIKDQVTNIQGGKKKVLTQEYFRQFLEQSSVSKEKMEIYYQETGYVPAPEYILGPDGKEIVLTKDRYFYYVNYRGESKVKLEDFIMETQRTLGMQTIDGKLVWEGAPITSSSEKVLKLETLGKAQLDEVTGIESDVEGRTIITGMKGGKRATVTVYYIETGNEAEIIANLEYVEGRSISIYDTVDPVEAGEQTTYVIEIKNEDKLPLIAEIPSGAEFVSASGIYDVDTEKVVWAEPEYTEQLTIRPIREGDIILTVSLGSTIDDEMTSVIT